jgi:hypothetical protein
MQCPTCQTELPASHPAFDRQVVLDYVKNRLGGWDSFESASKNATWNLSNGKTLRLVDSKTDYDTGDIDHDSYYGELPQGTEFDTFLVFQVGDAYFKKTGTGDSYGHISWDGELTNVTPVEKVVLVWQ